MCNSFAVYGDNPIYGMNFDYDDVELILKLVKVNDKIVFKLSFINENNAPKPIHVCVAAMDTNGLFMNLQTLIPNDEKLYKVYYKKINWLRLLFSKRSQSMLEIITPCFTKGELSSTFADCNSTAEVQKAIIKINHLYIPKKAVPKHHSLIADRKDAFIFEIVDGKNNITKMDDTFIIMSNFPNGQFKGDNYNDVYGTGDTKYKQLYEYITKTIKSFDEYHAKSALEMVVNDNTQASLIFLPAENIIKLYFKGEFNSEYTISLIDETILCNEKGFSLKMNNEGTIHHELLKF